jgi:hypothetical protein
MHLTTPLTLLTLAPGALTWAGLGHRTVGYLAQELLTPDAKTYVNALIRPSATFDISDAAVWPDTIRMRRPWTSGWHFIGTLWEVVGREGIGDGDGKWGVC